MRIDRKLGEWSKGLENVQGDRANLTYGNVALSSKPKKEYFKEIDISKREICRKELMLSEDITKEEWINIGKGLTMIGGSVQIWIGDWAKFGEKRGFYTDTKTYREIAKITGYEPKTIRNFKYVAENVESSLRRDDVSFGHLSQIASLSNDKQKEFLDKAVKEKLSVRESRS